MENRKQYSKCIYLQISKFQNFIISALALKDMYALTALSLKFQYFVIHAVIFSNFMFSVIFFKGFIILLVNISLRRRQKPKMPTYYAPPQKSGEVLCYTVRNFECPSVRPSAPHKFMSAL